MARVVPVPVLSDNYAYLLIDEATKECAAVDPQNPETYALFSMYNVYPKA